MARKKHPSRRAARTPRSVNRRLVAVVALAGAAALAFLLMPRASTRDAGGTGQADPAAADPAADTKALIGRWVRTDHPYVVEIRAVTPDGALDVQYLNPRPIHVSYAKAERHDSRLGVTIELNDQGYAGSLYTLTYEPGADRLVGTYRLPTRNEEYVVSFSRRPGG
jgi:hypothetical protein